jgi:predicted transcriptional regulator
MHTPYIMMRRTQIYLDDRQRRELDQVAKRTRRTVSDLIREAIDAWRQRPDLGPTDAYVRRLRRGRPINRLADR